MSKARTLERASTPPKRAVADFLKELEEKSQTVVDWAREQNFNVPSVYAVLGGRAIGRRGKARQIVKAMGLELPPMVRHKARSAA